MSEGSVTEKAEDVCVGYSAEVFDAAHALTRFCWCANEEVKLGGWNSCSVSVRRER